MIRGGHIVGGICTACLLMVSPAAALAATQSAPTVQYVYLGKRYPHPPPLRLLHLPPKNRGLEGAKYSTRSRNYTGKLVGYHFKLIDALDTSTDANIVAKAKALLKSGQRLFIADLNRDDLLKVAQLPLAKDAIFLNIHSPANSLRTTDCRRNIFDIIPSYAMRADAIAQYLIFKHWHKWLLVRGNTHQDKAFAASIRRAAKRFGGKIVGERTYTFHAGKNRQHTAHQQIETQMPELTRGAPDHDVVFVADESHNFGLYLPYRTAEPRPVVGSYGLTATAWTRNFDRFDSLGLQKDFRRFSGRQMTTRDYLAWLAVRAFGKAAIHGHATTPKAIRQYLLKQNLLLLSNRGRGLSFRLWNQQLRQPLIISSPAYQVAMAPLKGFLNPHHFMDTLGFSARETGCKLHNGD